MSSSFGLTGPETLIGASTTPSIIFLHGGEERKLALHKPSFTIGRKTENDLVISDPRVSREHAQIVREADGFYIVDKGSKLGTFVNGERVERIKLKRNDRLEFGVRGEAFALFDPDKPATTPSSRALLSQLSVLKAPASATSDLETLTLFLQAARKLNTSTVLEEVLLTLIETTLQITKAERGYVFLRNEDGALNLVVGRNAKGEPLFDDNTLSRSVLRDALSTASEFVLNNTDDLDKMAARESIVAHNLRTVICIPLRRTQLGADTGKSPEIRGLLYLDSKFISGKLSQVDHEILRTIANDAASLVENAFLVQAEEAQRRYQQEMNIAAAIQQRLMRVNIPDVPYAQVDARNIPSKDIGGDFYDVVHTPKSLTVIVTDVSGKGISAALLASILQGLLYAQLAQEIPLSDVVAVANSFLCEKVAGEKYATMLIARLHPDGKLEYINCGHIPPVLVAGKECRQVEGGNLPVGLIPGVAFESGTVQLDSGTRLFIVTDGVTEAEDPEGEMVGIERLLEMCPESPTIDDIFHKLSHFCAGTPFNDDCTVLQLSYKGPQ
jgi:serine phosphatase RsbU (regulator of sigma subunit)/pSer/pThr/pTyr-binding forkhead associated (FHA) protein